MFLCTKHSAYKQMHHVQYMFGKHFSKMKAFQTHPFVVIFGCFLLGKCSKNAWLEKTKEKKTLAKELHHEFEAMKGKAKTSSRPTLHHSLATYTIDHHSSKVPWGALLFQKDQRGSEFSSGHAGCRHAAGRWLSSLLVHF